MDVRQVAKGLTKAQRWRLNSVAELRARGLSWTSCYGSLSAATSRATTSALIGMGLLTVEHFDCRLTPAGEAVRAILASEEAEG